MPQENAERVSSPMRMRWSLQADVVAAVQTFLEENQACTLEDVADVIVKTSMIAYDPSAIRTALRVSSKYARDGKLKHDALAADVRKQRAWLKKFDDIPPMPTSKMSKAELDMIRAYYEKKRDAQKRGEE